MNYETGYAPGQGGAINPAVLAAFHNKHHKPSATPTPAQLMNAINPTAVNPSQLIAAINPASLASQPQPQQTAGISPAQISAMFNMSEAQFNALPPQQKQYAASQAQARAKHMREQQQQARADMLQQGMAASQFRGPDNQFRATDPSSMMGMNMNMNNMGMNMGMGGASQQPQQFRDQASFPSSQQQMMNTPMGMNMAMGAYPTTNKNPSQPPQPTQQTQSQPDVIARSASAMGNPAMNMNMNMYDRPSSSSGSNPQSQSQPQSTQGGGGGGMMLPPTGIPRMNMGMGNMGGMGMGMGMNNMSNMSNMGGMGNMGNMGNISNMGNMGMPNPNAMRPPMRPPSRAMSATPVNGASAGMMNGANPNPGANARGMSPSHGGNTQQQQQQGSPMGMGMGMVGMGQYSNQQQTPTRGQYPNQNQNQQNQGMQGQQQHNNNNNMPRSTPTPAPGPAPSTPNPSSTSISAPHPGPGSSSTPSISISAPPTPAVPPMSGSPPIPGSPFMRNGNGVGVKRRLTVDGNVMDGNGGVQGQGQGQGQGGGRPGSSLGMGMGMGMGGMGVGVNAMGGGMNMNMGMGMGMGMGGMNVQPQQQQHQRQTSVSRTSVPPSTGTPTPTPKVEESVGGGEGMAALVGGEGVGEQQAGSPLGSGSGSVPPPSASTGSVPPSSASTLTSAPPSSAQSQSQASSTPQPTSSTNPSGSGQPTTATTTTTSTSTTLQPLPPLAPSLTLNPLTTRITLVPLATSTSTIPPLTPHEVEEMKMWMEEDKKYEERWRGMVGRMRGESGGSYVGGGASVGVGAGAVRGWWEKGYLPAGMEGNGNRWRRARESFDVRYPRRERHREREGRRKRREGLRLPRKLDVRDTNKPEQLVPIRLEFDVEHHKMRDTFVWNLNDPVVTPEHFAQTVVEDYLLPSSYHAIITKSIQDQLSDYRAHSGLGDADDVVHVLNVLPPSTNEVGGRGKLGLGDDDGEGWWGAWRKFNGGKKRRGGERKRRKVRGHGDGGEEGDADGEDGEGDDEMDVDQRGVEFKSTRLDEMLVDEAKMVEEMRILVRLDIIVGSMKLEDQFEWDIENEHASPEDFAEVYAQDLGLTGEFKTAIAHSIREQIQTYQKSLFLVGHPCDGTAVQDEDLRMSFLPSLNAATRPLDQVSSFTPLLNYLSDGELDRNEKDREKDMNRRRKRNTRGRRGIALPDREPIRTYRTPAIGFPELDAAALAAVAAANAPTSKRAAAAAASLTIANMVASENGTAFLPQVAVSSSQVMTPPPPPSSSAAAGAGAGAGGTGVKVKKSTKGHFKAPSYPQEVLTPRAKVVAPTPSTAADVSTLPEPLENDPPPPFVTSTVTTISSATGSSGGAGQGGAGQGGGAGQQGDSRNRAITAKRAKELEREAKEKEFADGQHPNMIDGVWHCSNCGCPDSIAIGRRKGPLGDKSQCGVCGKYWHRHRRPRPVEYNPDPDFHNGLKKDLEQSKILAASKKKGAAAALRAQNSTQPQTPADTSEAQTPSRSNGGDVDVSARQSPDRALSPVSTASSASESPLAHRVKSNGVRRISSPPVAPDTPQPATSKMGGESSPSKAPLSKDAKLNPPLSPMSPLKAIEPPPWLSAAKAAMMAKYPNDRFEIQLRKVSSSSTPEWRIRCLDCPGKLYTPGPTETLANYEVHLKNRQHRQRVNDRLNNGAEA